MYNFELPETKTGYMTEKAVKQVMEEMRPESPVRFKAMPVDELDEYIAAWVAGTHQDFIEEMMIEVAYRDQFIKDTVSLLWTHPESHCEELKHNIRVWFLDKRANDLEQNIEAVLDHENCNEDAA
jgi:hypothetical protein